jgi:hypothetical protein
MSAPLAYAASGIDPPRIFETLLTRTTVDDDELVVEAPDVKLVIMVSWVLEVRPTYRPQLSRDAAIDARVAEAESPLRPGTKDMVDPEALLKNPAPRTSMLVLICRFPAYPVAAVVWRFAMIAMDIAPVSIIPPSK